MKKHSFLIFGLLIILCTGCQNLPSNDADGLHTLMADTVIAEISETAAQFTATTAPTAAQTMTAPVTATIVKIPTIAKTAATATVAYSYNYNYSYYYTATITRTPTVTGTLPTATMTGTATSYFMYMCSDSSRSIQQGDGCASFCSSYAASMEALGYACYSYGNRVYGITSTPTIDANATLVSSAATSAAAAQINESIAQTAMAAETQSAQQTADAAAQLTAAAAGAISVQQTADAAAQLTAAAAAAISAQQTADAAAQQGSGNEETPAQ